MCTAVTVITVGSKPLEWWMVEAWEGNCCLYVSIDSGSLTHRRLPEKETLQSLQPYRSTRAKIHQKMDTLPFSHNVLIVAMQNNIWTSKPNTVLPLDLLAQAHWFFSKSNCSLFPTPYTPAVFFFFCDSRALAFGRASKGLLSVYQSPTPGLSGRVVNFLYVVITYGEELLVSATPAAYELLP